MVVLKVFDYLVTGSLLMLVVFFCYIPIFFLLRKKQIPVLKQLSWVCFVGVIFVILVATGMLDLVLGGPYTFNPPYHFLNLIPFGWIRETWAMGFLAMISQVIGNILMFVPFGFLLPLVFNACRSFYKTGLVVISFSFSIELVQYFIGRSADIDDLILNTLGGMIGFLVYLMTDKLLFSRFRSRVTMDKSEDVVLEEGQDVEQVL